MLPDARLFLDTAFVQASLNSRDRYHLALTADHHFTQAGYRALLLE
ncbi:MAG: hypothetical protein JXR84_24795 [Anaerolineae bacterium]|nr:hypothetical protein [Anaerolineae bacterium]